MSSSAVIDALLLALRKQRSPLVDTSMGRLLESQPSLGLSGASSSVTSLEDSMQLRALLVLQRQRDQRAAAVLQARRVVALEQQLQQQRRAHVDQVLSESLQARARAAAPHNAQRILIKLGSTDRKDGDDYVDVLKLPQPTTIVSPESRSGVTNAFPLVLHKMILEAPDDIISFTPDGRSFVIHDKQRLVEEVLPKHCKQTKFVSFSRQLNLYGFRRMKRSGHTLLYHELFLRDHPQYLGYMRRVRVKPGC